MNNKLNDREPILPQKSAEKPLKRRGMRYGYFVYILECPLIVLFCGLMAFGMGWTGIKQLIFPSPYAYPIGMILAIMITFGAQATMALIAALQFWRYQREKKYPFSLYEMTLILIWGAPICALSYYLSVMIYNGMINDARYWLIGLIVFVLPFVLIAIPRAIYFYHRKGLYTYAAEAKTGSELSSEGEAEPKKPTMDKKQEREVYFMQDHYPATVEDAEIKDGEVVYARTHAEFLNNKFGTNYEDWMKSRWEYDADTWVWMVRFDGKIRDGWLNYIVDEHEIREEYMGKEPPSYQKDDKRFRIVVSIEKGCHGREYHILGKYWLDEERSTVGRHVLIKADDFT